MNDDLLDPRTALIHIMVLMSAVDSEMTDKEMRGIGDVVRTLPVFEGYDIDGLVPTAEDCAARLGHEDGIEEVLDLIVASLPSKLAETAYAIACEIAAADQHVEQAEIRMLELLRHRLEVGRLPAAAIERCVKARHATI
jgi:tellurite resistance protein